MGHKRLDFWADPPKNQLLNDLNKYENIVFSLFGLTGSDFYKNIFK